MNWRTVFRQYPAPFAGGRWIFWLLSAAPITISALFACASYEYFLQMGWIALTVLASAWEAHVRYLSPLSVPHTLSPLPPVKRATTTFLKVFLTALLVSIPGLFFLPHYQCYTDRSRIFEVIVSSSETRNIITQRVYENRTTEKSGAGLKVKTEGRVAGGLVTESGAIILVSKEPPAVVTLTPKVLDAKTGESLWTCLGFPEKLMPVSCRSEVSQ